MRFATFSVRTEPFADLYRAVVSHGSGQAGEPIAVVTRPTEYEAARVALEQATNRIAEDLTR